MNKNEINRGLLPIMLKELFGYFYRCWIVDFLALLAIFSLIVLYYPFHSWMFADKWRWASLDYTIRFYLSSIPCSFFMALILTFRQWIEMRNKDKKADEPA